MILRSFFGLLAGLIALGTAGAVPAPSLKPEAPASPFVPRDQAELLRQLFEALDDREYEDAKSLRLAIRHDLSRRIATWAILSSRADGLELSDYDLFLDENPAWPNPLTLQRKGEQLIDDETPAGNIIAYFNDREPLTGFGKLHLGRALLELGNRSAGREYIRKAWLNHNFTKEDSRDILKRYGRLLTKEDHFEKADRVLFNRRTSGVEDVEGLLTPARQREVTVRANLLRGRSNAARLFNALPEASKTDPGVLLAMVRYLRRQDREPEAIELAKLAPLNPDKLRNASSWFYERKLLARWAIKNGRFDDAYTLSAYSGLAEGADFAEAEFLAGWLALRFLNDPERARAHFSFLTTGVTSPISVARGNYWLARAYAAMGDETRARAHYLIASDFPYTFYGQMAIETLGRAAPVFAFPGPQEITIRDRQDFFNRPLARAAAILDHIDQPISFRRFALALDGQLQTEAELLAFAEFARDEEEWDLIVRAGKVARSNGPQVPSVIYPRYPVPSSATAFAEEPLILGLSRQESEFKADAVSSARAKGMMQLLNSTAKITARKEDLPYSSSRLLSDPDYNMTLGAAHLSHLLDRFNGSYVMVLAAYNAGPHRVDDWVETYGDPRDPNVDPIDWIELIPFSETRNYVMRVLENTQVYRAQIDGLPLGMQLTEDLTRGGRTSFASIGQPIPAPLLWQAGGLSGLQDLDRQSADTLPMAVIKTQEFPALIDQEPALP